MRVLAAKIIGAAFILFMVIASSVFFFNRTPRPFAQAAADDQKILIDKTNVPDGNGMPSLADQIGNIPTDWMNPNYAEGATIGKFVVTGKPSNRPFIINLCMWQNGYSNEKCSNTWELVNDGTYYINLNPSIQWWTKDPGTWNWNITPNDFGLVVSDKLTDKLAYYGCGEACFSDPTVDIRTHMNFSIKTEVYLVKSDTVFVKPASWADCPATICSTEPAGIKPSNLPAGTSEQVAITADGTLSVNPAHQLLDGYAPNKFMFNHELDPSGTFHTCDTVSLTSSKPQFAHHFKVPKTGVYNVWYRMFAPTPEHDSFKFYGYVQNGEFRATCNKIWGNGRFPTGQWQWVGHTDGRPGGGFTVYLRPNADLYFVYEQNEPGVKLDYMLLTTDLACKPSGEQGSNCADAYRYSIRKTLGQGPAITITPSGCTKKTQGDADCNGTISVTDYAVWRLEYKGACSSTNLNATACGDDKDVDGSLMDADFSEDDKVSLVDYQKWRTSIGGTTNPSPTITTTPQGTLYTAVLGPQSGATTTHTGTGSLLLAPDEKSAIVTITSTLNTTGTITVSHIHGPGALPDQFDLQLFPIVPGTQTIDLSGMTAGQINDLKTQKWYFNIHTFLHPAGEISGTIKL